MQPEDVAAEVLSWDEKGYRKTKSRALSKQGLLCVQPEDVAAEVLSWHEKGYRPDIVLLDSGAHGLFNHISVEDYRVGLDSLATSVVDWLSDLVRCLPPRRMPYNEGQ